MGSLPASTEIVLEIQLNRLIRDFLFPGMVGDGNVSPLRTEATEALRTVEAEARNCDAKPWKASNLSAESAMAHATTGEVRLNLHDQTSNTCTSQHTETVKLLWLCKSHSMVGSLFSFPMRKQGEIGEKEGKDRTSERSRKLIRKEASPCHGRVSNDNDKRFRHVCQKPPRPPPLEKSSDGGRATRDAVLVLHGTSKRSRTERKRHAGMSSSNAALWAFVFTSLFALAMLGEGFRSMKLSLTRSNSRRSLSIHGAIADSDMKLNAQTATMERTLESGPNISNQLEKEMQMPEFWMSKELDPS